MSGEEVGETLEEESPAPERSLCERSDECNVLEPGISVQDCTDLMLMCTDGLITSAYTDWTREVDRCLEFANCKNFMACAAELSDCAPFETETPEPEAPPPQSCGPECAYCWLNTEQENACPPSWNGDGECDCGCQFVDVDCS